MIAYYTLMSYDRKLPIGTIHVLQVREHRLNQREKRGCTNDHPIKIVRTRMYLREIYIQPIL